MYELNEVIGIDRRFQNSVNLSMDLNNQKKIDSYIPTRSAKSILNWYQKSVEHNTDNATILIGPYGKGKSHEQKSRTGSVTIYTKEYFP